MRPRQQSYGSFAWISRQNKCLPPYRVTPQVNLASFDAHLVAAILKRFFMELPEPLIPLDRYDKFVSAACLPSEGAQVR